MRLRTFSIENHSRLEDVTIEVRRHLVAVGPNDVGKSSLLRCFDLLLGAATARLYNELTEDDFGPDAEALVLEARFGDLDDDDKALFPDEITVDPAASDTSLVIRLEAVIDGNGAIQIRRFAPDAGHGRQLSRDQLERLGWRMVAATSTERDMRHSRNRTLEGILDELDLGVERAELEAFAQGFQTKLSSSSALENLRKDLSKHLSRALPTELTKDELAFVSGAIAADDVLRDVELHVGPATNRRNVANTSDGARALFAVALYDLVSASANCVGIDEPEAHLHPTSQRSLARLLREGHNQKVVATHSSDIVGAFSPDEIVAIKPGGTIVQPKAGFLSDRRLVERWWMRDRLEPLTAHRVLAVEGISDRIVLAAAAQQTERDLDRLGVCVIETDGAGDMGAVVELFGADGFDIKLSLLIDADAKGKTAKALAVDEADLEQHGVVISAPDLEGEYVTAIGHDELWDALGASQLFSTNELGNCDTSAPGNTRTNDDVAAFCGRRKYKVRAAMVVADLLTEDLARKIASVERLLDACKNR